MDALKFVRKILDDVGESGGAGFWTYGDVLHATNYIQNEIASETDSFLDLYTIQIPPDTEEVEAPQDMLKIISAYRHYNGSVAPIELLTESQIKNNDINWFAAKGAILKALIVDAAAEGYVRVYPILNNSLNKLILRHTKLPAMITAEDDTTQIEVPNRDLLVLESGVKALLYSLEREGRDKAKGDFYLKMYVDGINAMKGRIRKSRIGQINTIEDRKI